MSTWTAKQDQELHRYRGEHCTITREETVLKSVTRMIFELPSRLGTEGNTWSGLIWITQLVHTSRVLKGNQELGKHKGSWLFLWSCISKQLWSFHFRHFTNKKEWGFSFCVNESHRQKIRFCWELQAVVTCTRPPAGKVSTVQFNVYWVPTMYRTVFDPKDTELWYEVGCHPSGTHNQLRKGTKKWTIAPRLDSDEHWGLGEPLTHLGGVGDWGVRFYEVMEGAKSWKRISGPARLPSLPN